MEESILNTIKKLLGITIDNTSFDTEIIVHINSAFSTLTQLGIGPTDGFIIEDDEAEWSDFISDEKQFNEVKSYMYLKVRLLFDPPAVGYVIEAMERQIQELEVRMNITRENSDWVAPIVI